MKSLNVSLALLSLVAMVGGLGSLAAYQRGPKPVTREELADLPGGTGEGILRRVVVFNDPCLFAQCYEAGGHGFRCLHFSSYDETVVMGGQTHWQPTTSEPCNPLRRYTFEDCSGEYTDIGNCDNSQSRYQDP